MRLQLVGKEGGTPPIFLIFRKPWGIYSCWGHGEGMDRAYWGPRFRKRKEDQ